MSSLTIDDSLCVKCGTCVASCPLGLLEMAGDGVPGFKDCATESCLKCGHCLAVCPPGAVALNAVAAGDCGPVRPGLTAGQDGVEHLIKTRRSIRSFHDRSLEPEALERLMEITRWAPTGVNSQTVQWVLVNSAEKIRQLAGMTVDWMRDNGGNAIMVEAWARGHDMILRGAPHLAIAHDKAGSAASCFIAVTTLELAAWSFGVGACWAGIFMNAVRNDPSVAQAIGLPEGHAVHAALMLGYPKYTYPRIPPRRELRITRVTE